MARRPLTASRTGALGAALVAVAFLTSASADQQVTAANTWTEIAVAVMGLGACGAVVLIGARAPAWGAATIGLFAALTAFAALSITWSVQPDWSWFGADQLLFYLAAFAGAAALARLAPRSWPSLVGAIAAAVAVICAWSLLVKVFPVSLAPSNTYGRLLAPFGYWNALGACAALGLPAALWSGVRQDGGRVGRALSVPALTLMTSVVVLSYSRSALLAAVLAIGCWIAFVPLRLRSLLVLAAGGIGALPIIAWMLGHNALASDYVQLPGQDSAGHTFGVVVVASLAGATAAGFAFIPAIDRRTLPAALRRRIGIALIALVALAAVAGVGAVAVSQRGLTGEISHAWSSLTNPKATVKDTSGRFTQLGSSRPLYWHQALQVGEHALLAGAGELGYGVARLRYATSGLKSDQAHSYLMQTFADLGLIGIALTLALLGAWCVAAWRSLTPRTPWASLHVGAAAERHGLAAMSAIVLGFGVQSLLDWTWYFPGVSIPVLLCAGWLAGRGPLGAPVGVRRGRVTLRERPGAGAILTALVAVALGAAFVLWQPMRSVQELAAAENANSNPQAFADARAAAHSDPLSYEPLFVLSGLYQHVGDPAAARHELVMATRVQPVNPATWYQLGAYDFAAGDHRDAAFEMARVLALDAVPDTPAFFPRSILIASKADLRSAAARARKLRPHRPRGQHAAVQRRPAGGPDLDLGEVEVRQQPAQRPGAVEVQMVAERLGVALDPSHRQAHAPVAGSGEQQPAGARQDAPDLRQPAGGVGDVLDHLAGPDDVEGPVVDRERAVDRRPGEAQLRVRAARASQRGLGHVDPEHLGARSGQRGGQLTRTAAEVEHAVAGPHVGQRERPPQREVGGPQVGGQPLPQLLVVVPHGGVTRIVDSPTAGGPPSQRPGTSHRYRPTASASASRSSTSVRPDAKHPGSSATSDQNPSGSSVTTTVSSMPDPPSISDPRG
ncbi:MAG: O-antigen ligase family protein [Solirubrobacteraceae bacterium]|jgi:hypothetical protein